MPAPVALVLLKQLVLPQAPEWRNDNIANTGYPERSGKRRTLGYKPALVALLLSLIALPCQACGLDWRYDPQRDATLVRPTPAIAECSVQGDEINPVVLPQPQWPEAYTAEDSERGWQVADPQLSTGRPEAYKDNREAVRIAQSNQDQAALARSGGPLGDVDQLPDALNGINYRLDFGIQYRF
ncbi:hypothetical protein [Marinobacter fonticola]|uniref:hypothetical protein n=1 Tax=Marinobacter fonticola TaxID=2603215 RepID=UPI0011E69721|nr:hypothetical protein [Marinobacter fonticola]